MANSGGDCKSRRSLVFARSVPPHPCPLPQGEGEPRATLPPLKRLGFSNARSMMLPLPGGEGRGEGERIVESEGGGTIAIGCRNSAFFRPSDFCLRISRHFPVSIFGGQLFVLVKSEVHPIAPANQPIPAPFKPLVLMGQVSCSEQSPEWPVNVAIIRRNDLALVPKSLSSPSSAQSFGPHKRHGRPPEAQRVN